MSDRNQELERLEAVALRTEDLERAAEERFDAVFARAEAAQDPEAARAAPEFHAWLAARADTDAAWGRWAQEMDARSSHD